ncbi:MAG: DUF4384 domain-containing protein, partial [Gammaproteobacteria bacterium]|nr:DUF4384 domain-containing protein [Gammaproteobacteria bacterium]
KFSFYAGVSRDAYLHCYYQGADKEIIRIFPHQRQPDPYIRAGQKVEIPGKDALFDIVLEHPDVEEEILCLASSVDISLQLPEALKVPDIQPVPLKSLDEIREAYHQIGVKSLANAVLSIFVIR